MLILTVQTPITLDIASFCNLFLQGLGETHGYGSSSRSCSKGFALEGAESSAPLQTDKYNIGTYNCFFFGFIHGLSMDLPGYR